MAKRPPEDESLDAAPDDAPGATAFVRLEDTGKLPPPRAAAAPTSGAPKKGLQVQLPDDEPPPPKPKPKVAPPAAKAKGRRGAWWDEEAKGGAGDFPAVVGALLEILEDLVTVGAYARGANPRVDAALDRREALQAFLCQPADTLCGYADALSALGAL